MNWIRENKFLTGFIAVVVIGVGVLGYLLYTAWSTFSDVSDQYTEQAGALHQLQVRVPYPDQQNLAKYKAGEDDLKDATHDLAASLSQMVLPVDDMTPSAFQDRLRDTVSAVVNEAAQAGVKLPDHFSMDFDRYQTTPPAPDAAGPLGRQLAALKIAMDILVEEHIDALVSLQRTPLPQEGVAGGGGGGGRFGGGRFGQRGGGGGGEPEGGGGLVEKYPFEIHFSASQPAFQKVINDFAASNKQFFITRTLLIENSNPKPVSKETADASAAAAPAAPAGSPAPGGNTSFLRFLVGAEKLEVAMRIDMVAFNPPEKATRTRGARAH